MDHVCVLVGGPVYTLNGVPFEWSERFGPMVVNKRGDFLKNQPGPRDRKFWQPFEWWIKQGCRVTPEGACIYDVEVEPIYVTLAGRHAVEVPAGKDPEEVRREWFTKMGLADSYEPLASQGDTKGK